MLLVLGEGDSVVCNSERRWKESSICLCLWLLWLRACIYLTRLLCCFKPILFVDKVLHSEMGVSPVLVSGEMPRYAFTWRDLVE